MNPHLKADVERGAVYEAVERVIDQHVYRLYGLTEEEIKVEEGTR